MRRRDFLSTSIAAAMMQSGAYGRAFAGKEPGSSANSPHRLLNRRTRSPANGVPPMAIGVMIAPVYDGPETAIARVKELGMSNCFLSLDDYIGRFSTSGAQRLSAMLDKYGVTATSVEIVGRDAWCGISSMGRQPSVWCRQRHGLPGLMH